MIPGILKIFRPAPAAAVMISEPEAVAAAYSRWQIRVLIFSIIGYATFYLVRKNLGIAMPFMIQQLGITKEQLGLFLTLHGVLYGISKFLNGFLADRSNARAVMAVALVFSALLNVVFGSSSIVAMLGIVWMANGWFQGMGFPPCARLMANWFPPRQLATKFSIWNTSHNIGSIAVLLLCGFLVGGYWFAPDWRLCFFVPAVIAMVIAIILWFMLPDTPPSVGLPEFKGTHVDLPETKSHEDFKRFVFKKVFCNKYIW